MTPLDFLAAVLPAPGHGYYCAAELSTTKKEHIYATELEDLQPAIDKWHEKGRDVYFALATFEESGSRMADNAQFIRSLFIDMDGYQTKKAAAVALQMFLEKSGLGALGTPWVVDSGGGLHVYWPLLDAIPIAFWKPVAENLKRLCKQLGMAIDMTVTADAARVLRVPGSTNFKKKYATPRPVTIRVIGDSFDFADLSLIINGTLDPSMHAPAVTNIAGKRPKRDPNAAQVKLMQNSATLFENIYDKAGCAQLENYIKNAAEDGMEPIWRGLLSWTKVCEDGEDWGKWLSDLHPYTDERRVIKLAEIKGPYACVKMDSENPGLCQGCKHWGKITNPLVLGREVQTDNSEKQVVINTPEPAYEPDEIDGIPPEELADTRLQVVTRPQPPRGFSYGTHGGVYCEREDKDADGKKMTKHVQILPYDLFVVDLLKQESEHLVYMVATRPDKTISVTLPQKSVVSRDETVKYLASQNIIASYGKGNDNNLFDYVRACVEEASLNKRVVDIPEQAGWQKDGSFVYNNRVFTVDGREITVPMPGLENINRKTNGKGSIDDWRKAWNLFVQKRMYTMLALVVDSFGAPLMRFTGQDGFVWHIGSTESGTGKTLTLSAKAGVWGHPKLFRTGKGTSPVAMQQRLGLLNSLPLLIDEITAKSRADMEWAPAFVFDVAEGQGKERMESGANKERINNSTWATNCTMTSNTHLTDYLSGARQHSSEGELMRMLEWTPTKPLEWTAADREVLKLLDTNYGIAGEMWVRWLVRHQDVAADMVRKVQERLTLRFGFSDAERYWRAGCSAVIAAAILLSGKYAGIINLPVEGITEALLELVNKARDNMRRNVRTAEDVLNAYTRENYGSFVVIRKNEEKRILASWGSGETVDKSITRSKVLGRVEHGLSEIGYVDFFIEEQLLKQHCVSMSFGYADFKRQLESQYIITYIKKNMLSQTNGPTMRVNVMHIHRRADETLESTIPVGENQAG